MKRILLHFCLTTLFSYVSTYAYASGNGKDGWESKVNETSPKTSKKERSPDTTRFPRVRSHSDVTAKASDSPKTSRKLSLQPTAQVLPLEWDVLIVEDDKATRDIIVRHLTKFFKSTGYNVQFYFAETAEEAKTHLDNITPYVLLLDFHLLKDTTGLQVLENLGERKSAIKCIVAMSSELGSNTLLKDNGAHMSIVKPFFPKEIINIFKGLMSIDQSDTDQAQQTAGTCPPSERRESDSNAHDNNKPN